MQVNGLVLLRILLYCHSASRLGFSRAMEQISTETMGENMWIMRGKLVFTLLTLAFMFVFFPDSIRPHTCI